MKTIIVENSRIPVILSVFPFAGRITAITLWPFIFFRGNVNKITKNHESIHIEQYNDLCVLGFYAIYLFDIIHGMIKYRNDLSGTNPHGQPYSSVYNKAYYRLRAEQEAYEFEDHDYYLLTRKKRRWLHKYKV